MKRGSSRIDPDGLRRMWAAGVSSAEIAEKFGVKYPAVNSAAQRLGLPPRRVRAKRAPRPAPPCPDRLADLRLLSALDALAAGDARSFERAADLLGLTRDRLRITCGEILADASGGSCCATRPENRDGGMPPRWWARASHGAGA